jgi:hypothetical protein
MVLIDKFYEGLVYIQETLQSDVVPFIFSIELL